MMVPSVAKTLFNQLLRFPKWLRKQWGERVVLYTREYPVPCKVPSELMTCYLQDFLFGFGTRA